MGPKEIAVSFKHEKLKKYIIDEIKSKKLTNGMKIPSENLLSKEFNISRNTVRQSIKSLVNEGYLHSIRGKGSFVQTSNPAELKKIALMIYDSSHATAYITSRLIQGISNGLAEKGYYLDVLVSYRTIHDEQIHKLKEHYAGILIGSYKINSLLIKKLDENNLSYLFVKNYLAEYKEEAVRIDFVNAGFVLAEHLIKNNKRELFLIESNISSTTYNEFYHGVIESCLEYGACLKKKNILNLSNPELYNISEIVETILSREEKITGIICPGDYFAYEIITELKKHNIRIPEDIAVTGLNNTQIAEITTPSITTFDIPAYELGILAAAEILVKIQGGKKIQDSPLKGELIVRQSSITIE